MPINSIQQFLTTFAVNRVIISRCRIGLPSHSKASVEAETSAVEFSLLARKRKLSCSSAQAVIAVSRNLSLVKNQPQQPLHLLLCGNNQGGRPPTADRQHIAGHPKDY
ncbi:hypothetical protein [Microcoleus sp. PH2017_08_TRC_O_A]|uniref:hypothetical protein n=1 Tax=Microcoleus sp. PH2017_08_TRC_O_A TaxID=2798819 RepID=UPI001D384358|nr:hypothetical protein [Microcoleus sp. PH2017_08_TRC_O_A]MCC3455320.1 hypothetical protein [Microcoleus sp. PH2017_08_TRC_O_A]TAE67238.1 MAG: hypothetical protein EAZ86_17470 [Oscillatoriales cyanobacterium]